MSVLLDLQTASRSDRLPDVSKIKQWANAAIGSQEEDTELSIRIVDKQESQELNHQYRHKNKPTNVLSFPADLPEDIDIKLLGDLVICAPVVEEEAIDQNKSLDAHWAHMVVHGTLHLRGYDHQTDEEAEVMEGIEKRILTGMGFNDPYAEQ